MGSLILGMVAGVLVTFATDFGIELAGHRICPLPGGGLAAGLPARALVRDGG
ncbi:MAG: hypothetical protein QOJ27_1004 [Sphingomonadales bacterium]|nr:hypothetical protein [Sphingomonadales bacterium]